MRKTKIVCTLGPATDGKLAAMLAAGMNVARFNMSHGSHEEHAARIEAIHLRKTGGAVAAKEAWILFEEIPDDFLDTREALLDYAGDGFNVYPGEVVMVRTLQADERAMLTDVALGKDAIARVIYPELESVNIGQSKCIGIPEKPVSEKMSLEKLNINNTIHVDRPDEIFPIERTNTAPLHIERKP